MNFRWRERLGLSVAVAVGSLAIAFALSHSLATPSQAGQVPVGGAFAVDCDAGRSGIQSDCTYPLGDTFEIQIYVTDALATGYTSLQVKLRWTEDTVTYLPTDDTRDEWLWSDCGVASRAINLPDDPSALWGCVPNFDNPVLINGTDFEGAVLQLEFACPGAPPPQLSPPQASPPGGATGASGDVTSALNLVPWVDDPENPEQGYDPQFGTNQLDLTANYVNPATLTNATVTCTSAPPPGGPGPGPSPTGGPSGAEATPTAFPSTGAEASNGDGGVGARVWVITAALLAAGAAGLGAYGWRHVRPSGKTL